MIEGIVAYLIAVTFWPGLDGAALTPRWAALAVAPPGLLLATKPGRVTAAHLVGMLFLAWAAFSLFWAPSPYDGLGALFKLVILAESFVVGARLPSLRPVWVGLAAGLTVNGAVLFAQAALGPFWSNPDSNGMSGLFYNPNSLGEIAALVLVALCVERMWWWIPGILPAVWLPHSRAAWLALVVVARPGGRRHRVALGPVKARRGVRHAGPVVRRLRCAVVWLGARERRPALRHVVRDRRWHVLARQRARLVLRPLSLSRVGHGHLGPASRACP